MRALNVKQTKQENDLYQYEITLTDVEFEKVIELRNSEEHAHHVYETALMAIPLEETGEMWIFDLLDDDQMLIDAFNWFQEQGGSPNRITRADLMPVVPESKTRH